MAFTTLDLITSIKMKGQIPTSQAQFTTANILSAADDEILSGLVPLVMSVRESYFQTYKDTAIVDGTARYRINSRAVGMKLKELAIVDANGDVYNDLGRTEVEDQYGEGFYFEGSEVVLRPTPTGLSSYSLRQTFFRRPGTLVLPSTCGAITAIDTTLFKVTISSTPSTFTTSKSYDFVQANPGFDTLAMDQTASTITSNVMTFTSLPTGLAVGDYVALATQSPVVQLPLELHPVLALRTAITILRSLGHETEAASKQKELEKMEERIISLLNPRIEGEPKKIIARQGVLNPGGSSNRLFRF